MSALRTDPLVRRQGRIRPRVEVLGAVEQIDDGQHVWRPGRTAVVHVDTVVPPWPIERHGDTVEEVDHGKHIGRPGPEKINFSGDPCGYCSDVVWDLKDKLESYPPDLENYVVKPLFSFAGSGVVVSPSHKQLDEIPDDERNNYILQKKIEYSPVIKTPYGDTKVEIRLMFIWLNRLIPVNTLIRLSRSQMMNVDYNSAERWIGASVGFIPQ